MATVLSLLHSIPNTRACQTVGFSVPLLNIALKRVREQNIIKNGAGTLAIKAERAVIQRDFLTGIGIQAALAALLFTKFFKGSPRTLNTWSVLALIFGASAVGSACYERKYQDKPSVT
jgi:hypothetical protein